MNKGFVVAIDGPVASGKGTIAQQLAQKIHAINFNTGGIWRAYTYLLLENGKSPADAPSELLMNADVEINIQDDGSFKIFLNKQEITEKLSNPEISHAVSKFGLDVDFAKFIISKSREYASEYLEKGRSLVIEGRQIGTVVFPDAEVKIYLTAELGVRAKRRHLQYKDKGINKPIEEVLTETKMRDLQDTNREFGALTKNPKQDGYLIIDNSHDDEIKTLDQILDILQQKKLWQKI